MGTPMCQEACARICAIGDCAKGKCIEFFTKYWNKGHGLYICNGEELSQKYLHLKK